MAPSTPEATASLTPTVNDTTQDSSPSHSASHTVVSAPQHTIVSSASNTLCDGSESRSAQTEVAAAASDPERSLLKTVFQLLQQQFEVNIEFITTAIALWLTFWRNYGVAKRAGVALSRVPSNWRARRAPERVAAFIAAEVQCREGAQMTYPATLSNSKSWFQKVYNLWRCCFHGQCIPEHEDLWRPGVWSAPGEPYPGETGRQYLPAMLEAALCGNDAFVNEAFAQAPDYASRPEQQRPPGKFYGFRHIKKYAPSPYEASNAALLSRVRAAVWAMDYEVLIESAEVEQVCFNMVLKELRPQSGGSSSDSDMLNEGRGRDAAAVGGGERRRRGCSPGAAR